MKIIKTFLVVLLSIVSLVLSHGQTKFSATAINTSVTGTSTIHDWEMKSGVANCQVTASTDAHGHITAITAMKFVIASKSLKSGKSAMDKNAYKALKTETFANIVADLKSAKITTKDNVNFTVNAIVTLNIAGKSKDTDMVVTFKKGNANTYTVTGKKKISMSDYGVVPPSFMMGTVTTGNDVNLTFNFNINK